MYQENKSHPSLKGIRSTVTGILINASLAIIKGLAGILGNSYALIADALESLSDIFSSIILLFGLKLASKAPDEDHPYGHGKAEPIAASVVGLFLLIAAVFIIVESIHKINTPHALPKPFTLWVLILVIITKELLFRFVVRVGKETRSNAVKADAWHHRMDAVSSLAAFIGISIALYLGPGYEAADDWAALLASGVIIINAYNVIRPAIDEMMDIAPPANMVKDVREVARHVLGVEAIDKCYIRKMGFDFYVDLHVLVNAELSVREGHAIAHHVKEEILRSNARIKDVLIHIEPFELYSKV